MSDLTNELLREYADAFARGEHPDPVAFLDRAGASRDELRARIDAFLRTADPPVPDPELVAAFADWIEGRSPILELRTKRGRTQAEVVDTLLAELAVDASRRTKLARYYQRLENGLLDLTRVDGRVFQALARALGVRVADLVFPAPPPAAAAAAPASVYFRADADSVDIAAAAERLSAPPRPEQRDEVDELFEGAG